MPQPGHLGTTDWKRRCLPWLRMPFREGVTFRLGTAMHSQPSSRGCSSSVGVSTPGASTGVWPAHRCAACAGGAAGTQPSGTAVVTSGLHPWRESAATTPGAAATELRDVHRRRERASVHVQLRGTVGLRPYAHLCRNTDALVAASRRPVLCSMAAKAPPTRAGSLGSRQDRALFGPRVLPKRVYFLRRERKCARPPHLKFWTRPPAEPLCELQSLRGQPWG